MTLLLRQVANPLIVVLLVSGAVAIALGDLVDGAVVLGVVAANTLIGFLQEWRAGRAIEALGSMIPDEATVVRDGRRRTVPAADVVPGDLVELEAGERVPADARMLVARSLEIDESPLTGESLPVPKATEPVAAATPGRGPLVHRPRRDAGDHRRRHGGRDRHGWCHRARQDRSAAGAHRRSEDAVDTAARDVRPLAVSGDLCIRSGARRRCPRPRLQRS